MKNTFIDGHLSPILNNHYLKWLAILILLIAFLAVVIVSFFSRLAGLILFGTVCCGIVISLAAVNHLNLNAHQKLSDLSYQIHFGEQESLLQMPVGIMILNDHRTIEWINPYLKSYFKTQNILGMNLNDAAPDLDTLVNCYQDSTQRHVVTWNRHRFVLKVQRSHHLFYLMDITSAYKIKKVAKQHQLVIGEIFLDNYSEVTRSLSDQSASNLHNYVANQLSKWSHHLRGYLKPVDVDHFIILFYRKALSRAELDKFKILDRIRQNTSKQSFPVTLSIGIAYGTSDLNQLARLAQSNLDLALGRGGDQVVVKSVDHSARFYGGKTNPMEKRTRVRARMTSQALCRLMKKSDQIFVQGHCHPDLDALGACLGIHRIARMNNKKCWIVLNHEKHHSDVEKLLNSISKDPKIADAVIAPEAALAKATADSLLILVDHSKPSLGMSKKLYQALKDRVVVIDHHRRSEEFPSHPLLVYIEPYASSACELITEMVAYQSQRPGSVNQIEATAMLGGIITDTQSFSIRTGTRTFDAASYLRSSGANAGAIRQLMQENAQDYLARNHLISLVKFFGKQKDLALVTAEEKREYDPVTAAQAANSLLNIAGIAASFVITLRTDGQVGISARSTGRVNVQLVMERLGGGGHLSSGAAQIKGDSVHEVRRLLLKAIHDVNQQEIPHNSKAE